MKVPSKGSTVTVEGYGTGLFVKGPDMTDEQPEVWLKFESQEQDDGTHKDEIVPIPWAEFKKSRVYPEQQSSDASKWDNWDETMDRVKDQFGIEDE